MSIELFVVPKGNERYFLNSYVLKFKLVYTTFVLVPISQMGLEIHPNNFLTRKKLVEYQKCPYGVTVPVVYV